MKGKVLQVSDFGNFATMQVATDDRRIVVVPFDHRCFSAMLTASSAMKTISSVGG